MSATADVRHSFVQHFLMGAAIFARRALEIEQNASADASENIKVEHRACVVAAIMQSVAALEAEINEITLHGPGAHLGSDRTDIAARDFLQPVVIVIDRREVLTKYEFVLHILRRPALSKGEQLWQGTQLLVRLRNELVHYRSRWESEMTNGSLFLSLRALNFERPLFISEHSMFFPHHVLCGQCARWAVQTAVAFIDAFYARLDILSRLEAYRDRLAV